MHSQSSNSDIPVILVLLATRNGAKYVEEQIQSVLAQANVKIKIIVRDDSSTDETRKLVGDICIRYPQVILRDDHDSSGSASGNFFRLIEDASTNGFNYVALCDQDDHWQEDKLINSVLSLQANEADLYSSCVEAEWPNGRRKLLTQNTITRDADFLFEGAGQGCTFVMTANFFHKAQQLLIKNKAFLEKIHYHDWAIYAICRALNRKWFFDRRYTMMYRQHSENDTGARSIIGAVKRLHLIRSGWYKEQVNAINALITRIAPSHPALLKWKNLNHTTEQASVGRKLIFIATQSRRRLIDRVILMYAVIFGYL
jgi:rhamnosyltransferase